MDDLEERSPDRDGKRYREQQYLAIKLNIHKGDYVYLTLTDWIRVKKHLPSTAVEGRVEAITEKALLLEGCASIRPSDTCHCCGRDITNPTSLWCGYGPICSDRLGIPRDATEKDLERVMERLKETAPFSGWLPLSHITLLRFETAPENEIVGESISLEDL